ncbi:hypothetical protein [Skermanella aerolata]|nr:hypothetical protein [Skermanella aerolata]
MVAPLVLIGGGMVAGAMALWAAIKQGLDLSEPIRTRKGNGVRILTSQRTSSDGHPIVAAVNCGGDIGEAIGIYTKTGAFGGTLWSMDEVRAGFLAALDERDLTGLVNGPKPEPAPLSAERITYSAPRPPLDFSRPMRTQLGNRVQILALDRASPAGDRIVALVHLQWLDNDTPDVSPKSPKTARPGVPMDAGVTEQVVNVYDKFGRFHGTVISETEAERGKAHLDSPKFDIKRDTSDLCYSALPAS